MGLFDFFKRPAKTPPAPLDDKQLGPSYLEGFTQRFKRRAGKGVWQAKLITAAGNTKFRIKYYGQLHALYNNLIVGTTFAPALVMAIDCNTGEEILLFDGCKHGYNALFCDNYTTGQITGRSSWNFYSDKKGNSIFEISLITTNSIDYEDELADQVDGNGFIKLINGQKMEFAIARRDGYDSINITAIGPDGTATDILSEELA